MTSKSEVVISGLSCRLPMSNDMEELKYNLLNGVDMVQSDKSRMNTEMFDLPQMGELKELSKFDAEFFGVTRAQADKMDPSLRILLEVTYEAIVDAGIDPLKMRDSNTGVYVGTAPSQFHFALSSDMDSISGYEMTGSEQCMLANRLSYWFDFRGPSVVLNTACSSSLVALDQALKDVRHGVCSSAIVAGVNVLCHPGISKELYKLGMLSPTGRCASFDDSADGYCRSEGIVAIFIQKKETARRIYCSIVHSKVNNNGYTTEGILYPSKETQCRLLIELYEEANVDPSDVKYIEAHATGTQAGDRVEAESIAEIFCNQRSIPLKVGSAKSNLGHTENASGLVSIAKVIIAMETGTIPRNLHYRKPNQRIPQLFNGKLEVVHENTKLEGNYIGINNFGFGGTNAHVLLKGHRIAKQSISEESTSKLILYSSRESQSTKAIMEILVKRDKSFHSLLKEVNLMSGKAKVKTYSTNTETSFKVIDKPFPKQQVWFVFSGMGSQWPYMGKAMMAIKDFRDSILNSDAILRQFGVELLEIIKLGISNDTLINTLVSITAIQIALYDVLTVMGIAPFGIVGHSIGELVCAYADGCLSVEETLSIAYWRAFHIQNASLPPGAMAAIGLSWEETRDLVQNGVVLACHNAKDSVTVSGRKHVVETLVNTLFAKGIFAKLLNTNNIAFHSSDLKAAEKAFSKSLQQIIKCPRTNTKRWVTTVMYEDLLDSRQSRCFSTEYLMHSLTSPVYFYEAIRNIPEGSVVIEVAPHCLLQPLLRRSLSGSFCITGLMKRGQTNISFFLSNLGRCFEWGLDFNPQTLDGSALFPVPTGTPMISPVVKWDHSQTWDVPTSKMCLVNNPDNHFKYTIDISNEGEYSYIKSHSINGRILFPASGYLYLIWKSFSKMLGKNYGSNAIKFRDVDFHKAVILKEGNNCQDMTETKKSLAINILQNTGYWEIVERDLLVATGYVFESCVEFTQSPESNITNDQSQNFQLNRNDVYKELCLRGYNYAGAFQGIEASDLAGQNGYIRWSGNLVTFLDAMLQFSLLTKMKRGLYLPARIQECLIHPVMADSLSVNAHTRVKYVLATDTCETSIAVFRGLHYVPVVNQPRDPSPVHESHTFVPYSFGSSTSNHENQKKIAHSCEGDTKTDKQDAKQQTRTSKNKNDSDVDLMICVELVLENSPNVINVLEIGSKGLIQNIKACISKYPLHTALYYVSINNQIKEYTMAEDSNTRDTPVVDAEHAGEDLNCIKECFQLILIRDDVKSENDSIYISKVLADDGFVLIESIAADDKDVAKKCERVLGDTSLSVIYDFSRPESSSLLLCRKNKVCVMSEQSFFFISLCDFKWVPKLREVIADIRKTPSGQKLWLIAEERYSGLLGLVKCLRLEEEGCDKIRCIVNLSDSPIESQDKTINNIVSADMATNIINKDGCVGSLKYVPLKCMSKVSTTNAQVRLKRSGDLSSLTWTQSELESNADPTKKNNTVCYSALNFRDVMIATGKLSPAANPGHYSSPDSMLGMEFSGVDEHGKRVMGLVTDLKGISTSVVTRTDCVWDVPAEWTLEQAATVPMAYLSAYLALVVKGNISKGETVLIHSGSGGLGQAAISIALSYECTIFTTVGSNEKMEFLLSKYPMLEKVNIFSSRTKDFEQKIKLATGGTGVDIVLNSLAGEFLYASIRVLNSCGRFLEMGKYDLFQNASLGMKMFLENSSFIGVHLDFLIADDTSGRHMKRLSECFTKGIADGVVKALNTTVFDKEDVEKAFRLMAQGKHIGKVLIKLREENQVLMQAPKIYAEPRLKFDSGKWYIITGGLGGIGLELAEWLTERGVKSLVLTSKNGVRTSYQRRKLSFLRDKGTTIENSTKNVANIAEARTLVESCKPVGGIFHLAMVLKDGLMQNQDEETFRYAYEAKAQGAINLDLLTRELFEQTCDWFVCFSSIVSGKGNIGQTNYGYANSITERVCENRAKDGLHGLAIQFGPIAEVGIFHNMENNGIATHLGAEPQNIASCFSSLEKLMNHSEPVVSCFIPEEKNIKKSNRTLDIVSAILKIIGVEKQTQLIDDKSLSDLGLDSLMSIEVRQLLERQRGTTISLEQIQNMTIKQLKEMSNFK